MWNILLDVYIHDFHEVKTVFWGKEFSMPTNTAHTEKKNKNMKIYIAPLYLSILLLTSIKSPQKARSH